MIHETFGVFVAATRDKGSCIYWHFCC